MPILLVEMNVTDISVDESLFTDNVKEVFVREHLQYYYSKIKFLPAIDVKVIGKRAFVTQRNWYLTLAKDLGRTRIRAIIDKSSSERDVKCFLQRTSVKQLDWKTVVETEHSILFDYNWYVCFFRRPLSEEEKQIFEEEIVGFFRSLEISPSAGEIKERIKNLGYPQGGLCAEFQAFTPIVDESWFGRFRATMIKFHLECVQIVSFQGREFTL